MRQILFVYYLPGFFDITAKKSSRTSGKPCSSRYLRTREFDKCLMETSDMGSRTGSSGTGSFFLVLNFCFDCEARSSSKNETNAVIKIVYRKWHFKD